MAKAETILEVPKKPETVEEKSYHFMSPNYIVCTISRTFGYGQQELNELRTVGKPLQKMRREEITRIKEIDGVQDVECYRSVWLGPAGPSLLVSVMFFIRTQVNYSDIIRVALDKLGYEKS